MKKSSKNYIWILVANGLLIATVAIVFHLKATTAVFSADAGEAIVPVLQGDMARMEIFNPRKSLPPFVYLKDLESEAAVHDLKGQWTLLNLWATWCAPCLTELPSLQKLHDAYSDDGFQVVAISLDIVQDPIEIQAAVKSYKLGDIALNWDSQGEIFRTLPQGGIPISYILDPEGNVFAQFKGDTDWSSPDAHAFVDSLLEK